ncbi:MAG: ChbG/HpnK family deacetylase [Acidaminococcaceae bacterium]|nr:ChbG/HpnK family deacetylase [Acidaminococcaceae bacterium]
MKHLIVNADDFGLDTAVNDGIVKGWQEGFITSASLMSTAPAFNHAVTAAKANPGLGIGIHLTLVGSLPPLSPPENVRSLVGAEGLFLPDYPAFVRRYAGCGIKMAEVRAELRAQIAKVLAAGLAPTHVDSHQHLHVLPGIIDIVCELCGEFGIKSVRLPAEDIFWSGGYEAPAARKLGRAALTACALLAKRKLNKAGLAYPGHFYGMLAGGRLDKNLAANILKALPEGASEIMTHPGNDNAALGEKYGWGYHWEEELAAFLDEGNSEEIRNSRIVLINFGGLNYAK